jgi:CubicO group peptidase (beta-lactamase class C family)
MIQTTQKLSTMTFILGFYCFIIFSASAQNFSLAVQSGSTNSNLDSATVAKALIAKNLGNLMGELYETNQFNGSVLVARKGEVIFQQAYGWANIQKKDTFTLNTPVRLASVSKQFTAMAIMMLKERGKLNYDDDIRIYLPELSYEGITIRHLLQHQSGLTDYFGIGWNISRYFPAEKLIRNKDLLEYFSAVKPKLQFKPGKSAGYSNTGYVFLALIVERAGGMSYPMFMHKYVFEPLAMKTAFVYTTRDTETQVKQDTVITKADTSFISYNEMKISQSFKVVTSIKTIPRRRAIGYEYSYAKPYDLLVCDYHQFDGMYGEKGVCASVEDLLKWDNALTTNRLVSKETFEEAVSPSYHSDRKEWKYGFGWKIFSDDTNITFHHGLYRGFRNYLQRNLDDQTLIIVLSNLQIGRKMVTIIDGLNKILAGKDFKLPKQSKLEKEMQAKFKESYRIDYSGGKE